MRFAAGVSLSLSNRSQILISGISSGLTNSGDSEHGEFEEDIAKALFIHIPDNDA